MKVNLQYERRKLSKRGFRSRFECKVNMLCEQIRRDRLSKKLAKN